MNKNDFKEKLENIIPLIKEKVLKIFRELDFNTNYKTIWHDFQETAIKEIAKIIKEELPESRIVIPKSKSTYPDLKITYENKDYAIDIKSNESEKQPWYDIARLDTIFKERLDKYEEEYDIIIKYEKKHGRVIAVYIEPMYKTVGMRDECKGVKYRPYDGKLRPKSWEMFEKGKAHWNTKEEFIQGVYNSMFYRWKEYIKEWWKKLPKKHKKELLNFFKQNF